MGLDKQELELIQNNLSWNECPDINNQLLDLNNKLTRMIGSMIMDKYESYAVGHFLSSYPEDWSFKEITQAMREGSDEICPWKLVNAAPLEDLAGLIEDMASSLRTVFK